MADLKISELNALAGSDLVAADVLAVVDDSASETKKLTVSDLIANGVTLISDDTIPGAKILFSAGDIAGTALADGGVGTTQIAADAVTAAKLANESTVDIVTSLPDSGAFDGQLAYDSGDDKIYLWDGSDWKDIRAAGSINTVDGDATGVVNITATTDNDTVTITATLDNTSASAQFLAGPTGDAGAVSYRAIAGADLPTATTSAKGGVIVNGNGLTMSSDTIQIDNTVIAETTDNHIVQYDANGLVTSGREIVAGDIPIATSSTTGAVRPGNGLSVDADGDLNHSNSITAGSGTKVTFDAQGHITDTSALVAADIPDLDTAKITTGTFAAARLAADSVTAEKLADRSTATIATTTPAGGAFIGQTHLNSLTGDYFLWDGNVWQPIGISVGEIVLAGTYDASTNLMATVTAEGTALSFVVGQALPAASEANKGYYVVVSEAGTGTSPAPAVALSPPDFILSTGTAYTEIDVSDTLTAQVAENVGFTAAGNIVATNVQSAIEELDNEKVGAASPTFTGNVTIDTGGTIIFEGTTDNDYEVTLDPGDPTSDITLTLPNVTGTLVSTGDTGTVTNTMLAGSIAFTKFATLSSGNILVGSSGGVATSRAVTGDVTISNTGVTAIGSGVIVNADISSSAEIAVSKLANGTARQLLQTDSAGTGVEFASNIDVPGTLDVTGATTLDSTLAITGQTTLAEIKEATSTLTGTDLDPDAGSVQIKTLAANTTFTESLEDGQSLVLHLINGASYTVTWPTITWVTSSGNTAPTLTANDVLVFWQLSTTLYGAYVGSAA